ncbi:MAG: YicC/YloC family endoribonuclease [Gammaproteobacteria bacterium]|nr:YicC/YloC family endoribonuclease [Gammaproteobacteria bacterium]
MTNSMTAFARAGGQFFAWEIRSVNQRHLDVSFRMPEDYRAIEADLRAEMKRFVHRGKVECALRIESGAGAETSKTVDEEALRQLARLVDRVAAIGHNVAPVSPLELLKWPGVLQDESRDFEALTAEIKSLFVTAMENLVAMRAREGAELERVVLARLDSLSTIVDQIRAQVPSINERLLSRLRERVRELDAEADPARLETELVILAQKADVQEELDRLGAHVTEVRKTFKDEGPIGRRLDFLMQELNREANTVSSKSSAAEMSIEAVELKVLIEQMREQVQNIE